MLEFEYCIELKDGFRRTLSLVEENEIDIRISAPNRATADRMINALLKDSTNVMEISGICIGECKDE